jgi:hypothetical protein
MTIRLVAIGLSFLIAACTSAGKHEESSCISARGMGVHGVTTHCETTALVSDCEACREPLRGER